MALNLDRLLRPSLRGKEAPAYPSPPGGFLHLEANTNLFGAHPAARRALAASARTGFNQYPTEHSDALRSALADFHNVEPGQLLIGNGSDEVIDLLTKAYVAPGARVAFPAPSFVMYRFYAGVNLGKPTPVPLAEDWGLHARALAAARAPLTLVASPNNPTGNAFPERELLRLVRAARGIVAVDEAYAAFAGQDLTRHVRRHPNLIVLRTFSKSHGLAGLRVGYALGGPAAMERLYRAKAPYNVSAASEAVAVEALADGAFVDRTVEAVRRERPRLVAGLTRLGFRPYPSDANFVLVECPIAPRPIVEGLRRREILVREFPGEPRLARCIRVTVGPASVTRRFLAALREAALEAAWPTR
ncbi:MAG: histidinol-phosphate transaminase [Planctomycetes bacterium]|nr:histidinol-phosphate transaminase [Planctomycetota bacterium]